MEMCEVAEAQKLLKKIQKLLKDKDFINGINKVLKFLGEDKLK